MIEKERVEEEEHEEQEGEVMGGGGVDSLLPYPLSPHSLT